MKLRDVIKNVRRDDDNLGYADLDEFARAVNVDCYLGWNHEWDNRVKAYWVKRWLCTDTWVGIQVVDFDGETVAVTTQLGRKSGADVKFISHEKAIKVKDFIMSLTVDERNDWFHCIDEEDFNEECPEYYSFSLSDYFTETEGFVNGEPVRIVTRRHFEPDETPKSICYSCEVEFVNTGLCQVVNASDVKFRIRVSKV